MINKAYLKTKRIYNRKFIIPFIRNSQSAESLALGFAMGIFWGLTPTVGFQIYLVLLQWIVQKYILRKSFDLSIALILVWISNPITIVPFYIIFYHTGTIIMNFFQLTFVEDNNILYNFLNILNNSEWKYYEKIFYIFKLSFNRWFLVMMTGSLVYAIPITLFGYWIAKKVLIPLKIKKTKKKK